MQLIDHLFIVVYIEIDFAIVKNAIVNEFIRMFINCWIAIDYILVIDITAAVTNIIIVNYSWFKHSY